MNGENTHHTGTMHVPPEPGSAGYIRVVARGCAGHFDYYGDFDCGHEYSWRCEDCPINIEGSAK